MTVRPIQGVWLLLCLPACAPWGEPSEAPTSTPPVATQAVEPTPSPSPAPSPSSSPEPGETPAPEGFVLAAQGCPMAHCDPRLSDLTLMPAPEGAAEIRWHNSEMPGSNYGLGCSSNGSVVACSFGGVPSPGPFLAVFDADGTRRWASDLMNFFAFSSAPMVSARGEVIAADTQRLALFDPGGAVVWDRPTAGGIPVSPVLMADLGVIVLAGLGGPVAIHSLASGELLETLELRGTWQGQEGSFQTRNSPVIKGDRVYVSTEFSVTDSSSDEPRPARLYALEVDPQAPPGARLRELWHFEFGARSGASPLRLGEVIYFDGDRLEPSGPEDPHFFAVRDDGDHPTLVWRAPLPGPGFASAAEDPRGGLWAFGQDAPELLRYDALTGEVLQSVDLDALVPAEGRFAPASAMSVAAGPAGQPVLLVTALEEVDRSSWLVAVDLASEQALWSVFYGVDATWWSAAQLPIARTSDGEPVVVMATFAQGVMGIGAAPALSRARP